MNLDLGRSNTRGIIANLYAADARVQAGIREVNRETQADALDYGKEICPKDTTYMSEKLTGDLSEGGLRWSIGWKSSDFEGVVNPYNGRVMVFYPPYVEHGTFRSTAQPTLGPTMAAVDERYRQQIREIVRAGIARRRGNG